jgi:Asp-tRNA(Asn)/Glu-tRNA(Gln) amidotransferase A subunit family amidase
MAIDGNAIHQIGAPWFEFLHAYPVIFSLVCCQRPWRIRDDESRTTEIVKAIRMVIPVNILLGLPSCAAALGATKPPPSVQLVGRRFREDLLLLDPAQALEDRAPSYVNRTAKWRVDVDWRAHE